MAATQSGWLGSCAAATWLHAVAGKTAETGWDLPFFITHDFLERHRALWDEAARRVAESCYRPIAVGHPFFDGLAGALPLPSIAALATTRIDGGSKDPTACS